MKKFLNATHRSINVYSRKGIYSRENKGIATKNKTIRAFVAYFMASLFPGHEACYITLKSHKRELTLHRKSLH